MKPSRSHHARGIIMVELAIALFVVAVLAGATAYTLMHFAQTRAHYALRQTAAWAADGQLQRLMAGAPLDSLPPEGTISSGIELTIRHQGGDGVWSSMTLVCVQATVTPRHAKRVVEEACGYVTTELVP